MESVSECTICYEKCHEDKNSYINSYRFIDKLCDALSEKDIITADMGTALLSGHQAFKIKRNQRFMTSTGLGEMGFGLPAALGACFANNKKEIFNLNCDGGMMLKRLRPAPQGRAHRIRKRSNHVTVVLGAINNTQSN
jgi:thiamine pyrophosphate-dependent acetolactate synthase large subunit-like protein